MTLVNVATGELVASITEADVDASIERVIRHAESIWDEWVWQVENETWLIKGYASWDEMRIAVYSNLNGVTAPRAERPELVARFRQAGLTQRQTAETLGVHKRTVENFERAERESHFCDVEEVVLAEVIEDEPPKRIAPERPSDDVSLINDIRLYLKHLASSPQIARLSTAGRQHIITALSDTITALERI